MAQQFVRYNEKFLEPDPKFDNELASIFINAIMEGGKKSTAQNLFYDAVEIFDDRINRGEEESIMDAFEQAVDHVKPHIEVRSRRVGGATYQVPMEVDPRRQTSLAIRWIMQAVDKSRDRKGIPADVAIANELTDAYNQEGSAISTRKEVHRMAEANQAFAHLAW